MIRRAYINNQVLSIYNNLESLVFPLDPKEVIKLIPDCRYMSYQKMAKISNSSVEDVIELFAYIMEPINISGDIENEIVESGEQEKVIEISE